MKTTKSAKPAKNDLMDRFREYAVTKLGEYLDQISRSASMLSTEQLWARPNENSNAAGNLILHLTGNVRQWIIAGLGGDKLDRDRPTEFSTRKMLPAEVILPPLTDAVRTAQQIIESIKDDRLISPVQIQGYDTTGMAAIFHVIEHFAFHTGQIVWLTKAALDVDLSLYDNQGQRLDGRDNGVP